MDLRRCRISRRDVFPVNARPTSRFGCLRWLAIGALVFVGASRPATAELTPESPEVQEAVRKAVAYLARPDTDDLRLGGKALIGLAIYKATGETRHPQIIKKIGEIRTIIADDKQLNAQDVYSLGIAIIFLANIDAKEYQADIQRLLAALIARQKPHGGWGYPHLETGDTSMTQYAVLGLWEADRQGYKTPVEAWEKVCNWLLRTQDPSGGFGYQGIDPGTFQLVPQSQVRHSLTAGGLASLFLCADFLGLRLGSGRHQALPSVLKRIEQPQQGRPTRPRIATSVDDKRVAQAQTLGAGWFNANWNIKPEGLDVYLHYYLYALERYESFREAMNGPPESHPWYEEGSRVLLDSQAENGNWVGRCDPAVDTAFSVLFLVRSTRQALGLAGLGSGSLIGGRGIPKAQGGLRIRGGDIVASPLDKPAEQLLTMMEDADDPESLKAAESFMRLAAEADEETLNKHAVRLRKLARSSRPEARVAAVQALGRGRQLDHVPTLIYALSDPDIHVVTAAVEALRLISRQRPGSQGTVITDELTRKAAIEYWKAWYLAIRPEADLSDIES
jgi:hypothetical protein